MMLGEHIAARRRALGLTQGQLAERLDVSFQAVSQWERGETAPELTRLYDIAAALETTPGALLDGRGQAVRRPELERIFDRFYRVDDSRGSVPGHGLGLSIARIIAVNHGGKIHVLSREGAGSEFTLDLPGVG